MARRLGTFKTSMLQDMEGGKSLEIDGLLTGTLEIARKAGARVDEWRLAHRAAKSWAKGLCGAGHG
jgi:ketopantoate reductase